jgi:hypothetical protein
MIRWPTFVLLSTIACGAVANGVPDASIADASFVDSGVYHQGVYTCCGPNDGVSCCTADAGLLGYETLADGAIVSHGARPDNKTEANCFHYGGTANSCTPRGSSREGKDICSLCCDGLTAVSPMELASDGSCTQTAPISLLKCLPCGNGICDPDEDKCSCPADCH